jgi:hypothetical protein
MAKPDRPRAGPAAAQLSAAEPVLSRDYPPAPPCCAKTVEKPAEFAARHTRPRLAAWKENEREAILPHPRSVNKPAARAFATCRKKDAVPYLLRYLKASGAEPSKAPVVEAAIHSLGKLYGEQTPKDLGLDQAVRGWIRRIESGQP